MEKIKFQGIFLLEHFDKNGALVSKRVIPNLITSAGKAGLASRIAGSGSEAAFDYIAVGTGTTAAVVGDTTLGTEVTDSGMARAAGTTSRVTTTVANDTARLTKSFSVTATKAITEMGILNASSGGVLLCRVVFTAENVTNGDTLVATYDVSCA